MRNEISFKTINFPDLAAVQNYLDANQDNNDVGSGGIDTLFTKRYFLILDLYPSKIYLSHDTIAESNLYQFKHALKIIEKDKNYIEKVLGLY